MKANNLNHFKIFPKECDILSPDFFTKYFTVCFIKRSFDPTLSLGVHASERAELTGRGLYYTYHINTMQNQKSTENQKNQQQNIFQLI